MQRNINSLIGYKMEGTDGEIGKVEDFYFDDEAWTMRYLILKTGNWLSERKVLISPQALIKGGEQSGVFPVNLTKEQIINSPDIDTDKPVSRQQEIELHGYFPWQSYWGEGYYDNGVWSTTYPAPFIEQNIHNDNKIREQNQHLRSVHEVTGYYINATDGDIGHVKDFIIDDITWKILYLVVDTHNWFGDTHYWFYGKKVLVPVEHVKEVEWSNSKVFLNVGKASVIDYVEYHETKFSKAETSDAV